MKRVLSILAMGVLLLLGSAPMASADLVFGGTGTGLGQYQGPKGIAVDTSSAQIPSGRVYVADTGNNRVVVFDASGAPLFSFGSSGTGAGQFAQPTDIAVDPSSHAVYVMEQGNRRVQKFDFEGNFQRMWGKGVNTGTSGNANLCTNAGPPSNVCGAGGQGSGPGEFAQISGIAVGVGGDVRVADFSEPGTPVPCPIPGVGGNELPKRVQSFDSAGTLTKTANVSGAPCGRIIDFALDPVSGFYLATSGSTGAVRRFDELGNLVVGWGEGGKVDPSFNIKAITLNPVGELFVADNQPFLGASELTILRFDATGTQNLIFFGEGTLKTNAIALAFHSSAGGDVFAIENGPIGRVVQLALPLPGPLFVPNTTLASPVGNVRATLQTTFNPEGKPSTARFQYVDKASFEAAEGEPGGGFSSPNTKTTPESEPTPGGFENQSASSTNTCVTPGEPTCLIPETTYYFRAIAKNADGEVFGERAEFTTKAGHEVEDLWASEVGTDGARLNVEANPLGIQSNARFQYIPEGPDYQANGFANASNSPAFALGAGEATLTRAAQLSGLEPGTTYHYRVFIEDAFFDPVISEELTFTTFDLPAEGEGGICASEAFRTGASANLPDCRAYEMVTPLDKSNGDVRTLINATGYETNLDQSSLDGSRFAYTSYRAFANPESAPYTNQYMAQRTERGQPGEGWSTENLSPVRSSPPYREDFENEYKAFSPDLSQAWLVQEGAPTLDPCAPEGVSGLYRRDIPTKAYEALSCAPVGQVAEDTLDIAEYMPEFQGASSDGSKALIRMDDALTEDASAATGGQGGGTERPVYQTYLSTGAGQLRLVSVLPDGTASDEDSSAGTALEDNASNHNRSNRVAGAISQDGTRVFWTAGTGNGEVYLRLNADQAQSKVKNGECTQPTRACTIPVSETVTPSAAVFQIANPQGTEALFTVTQGTLARNLYRFDAETGPPESTLIAEDAQGSILGASEDLSHVYFASSKASAQAQSEGAIPGEPNIYLDEEGTTRFVATLSSPATVSPYSDIGNSYGRPTETSPVNRTARVSPDGQSLVFMSNSPALAEETAGYDNTDLASGQRAFEVYRYGAAADALACVSCNPSGTRAEGQEIARGVNNNPGPVGAATIPLPQTQLHQPGYLSDDGSRVFFESFEALTLGDTNGAQDIYQWEEEGAGTCTPETPTHVDSSEGCLSLISSGKDPDGSEFLDASPSGDDVFFTTAEGLAPQDYGLVDAYDARVGGGFPPPPAPPAACEGEACQPPAQGPSDATPASAATQGAGNVKATPNGRRCAKGKVRRRGRCVKAQKRKAGKQSPAKRRHRRSR